MREHVRLQLSVRARRWAAAAALVAVAACGGDTVQPELADFCREARRYYRVAVQNPGFGEPAKLRDYMDVAVDTARRLRALAPADIAVHVKTVVNQLERQDSALREVGYDGKKLTAADLERDPAVEASGRRLSAYLREHCGFRPGS